MLGLRDLLFSVLQTGQSPAESLYPSTLKTGGSLNPSNNPSSPNEMGGNDFFTNNSYRSQLIHNLLSSAITNQSNPNQPNSQLPSIPTFVGNTPNMQNFNDVDSFMSNPNSTRSAMLMNLLNQMPMEYGDQMQ